jgi:sec-independent protein translocase protein TatC
MATGVESESKEGTAKRKSNGQFDPDDYRMTIGEHLEELRTRLFLGLGAYVPVAFICMLMGERLVSWFLQPLFIALRRAHMPEQVYYTEAAESFMVYIQVSLIVAAVITSPWAVYQIWQFVASGLYPHERKYVTKYMPLSIALLVTGMLFLYYVVLPIMLLFFLNFTIGIPRANGTPHIDPTAATQPAVIIPSLSGDPANPVEGQAWLNAMTERLNVRFNGETRSFSLTANAQATPQITLQTYISMVINMLLSFGVAFQMPLVVLALVRIGIFDLDQMKRARRYVYFAMSIVAAFIVPDVVTGMIALMVPLMLLFEMGLWLARPPKDKPAAT